MLSALVGLSSALSALTPLSMQDMQRDAEDNYGRGTYLIIIAKNSLEDRLYDPIGGDFVYFKNTQGFDVDIMSIEGTDWEPQDIRDYIHNYKESDPMLEYVLLVGDVNQNFPIPAFTIPSINEPGDYDVTDYPYTFFNDNENSSGYDAFQPGVFIGRWCIQDFTDFYNLKSRSIQYVTMENVKDTPAIEYLNRALLVAGNFKTNDGNPVPPQNWPVTPVFTSLWLQERLQDYGYSQIDTAFYHAGNYQNGENNPLIASAWNAGAGVINYRGWGDANGWHKPYFHRENVNNLYNQWKLPIVMSFVCNTGDFGNDYSGAGLDQCYGEAMTTYGSFSLPKGAAAMVGPSDLDTDTKYNNVICGGMWDALLDGRQNELAPALHAGKQSLIYEFTDELNQVDFNGNPGSVYFYHHIYGVIGDPSIPVLLGVPEEMTSDLTDGTELHESHVVMNVTDESGEPLQFVVGALMVGTELIGKGLSTESGELFIDFSAVNPGSVLDLYLNKAQYFQKKISLTFVEDNGNEFEPEIQAFFEIRPIIVLNDTVSPHVTAGEEFLLKLSIDNPTVNSYSNINYSVLDEAAGADFIAYTNPTFNLAGMETFTSNQVASGTIDSNLPIGTKVWINAQISIDGQIIFDGAVALVVGPVTDTDPIPPDEYGYWAYDNHDITYPEAPMFDWIELNPEDGGEGIDLELVDDTMTNVDIGFDFTYYGNSYNQLVICSNGWASFEPCPIPYFSNFAIPMALGPDAMIAPFNDDLDDNNGTELFNVFKWFDEENHRLIVQWDNVANNQTDQNCPANCEKVTFELILYDPDFYETATGDGEILFQYQEIVDLDGGGGKYSTIGIESPDQNVGTLYRFNNSNSPGGWPLENGLAIKFTTDYPSGYLSMEDAGIVPVLYQLFPAYPNPFNPNIAIPFELGKMDRVRLDVFDVKGRIVETVTDNIFSEGKHSIHWNAANQASGVYYIRMQNGSGQLRNTKVTLIK